MSDQPKDEVVNGVYLRDGKPLYTLPGDNDRAVAAYERNKAAAEAPQEKPGADTLSSSSVSTADTNLLAAAELLFTQDAAKTGYAKSWADAPDGMKAHFIRLADTPAN